MGEITVADLVGLRCDATGCTQEWRLSGPPVYPWNDDFWLAVHADGWRVFVGRNRRHYCPSHGPISKNLREVLPR